MKTLSVDKVIKDLRANGTKLIEATTEREDISLASFTVFLELIHDYRIKIVFIHTVTLDEDELEIEMITEDDLGTGDLERIKDKVHLEVTEHNDRLRNLAEHIGEEQVIHLFFQYEGIIYSFNHVNYDLIPDLKEDFFEEMIEKYQDTISDAYEEARVQRKKHLDRILGELKEFLINSDEFKMCTNSPARKGYVYQVIKLDQFKENFEGMPTRIIMTAVDAAWQHVKLNKSLGNT